MQSASKKVENQGEFYAKGSLGNRLCALKV